MRRVGHRGAGEPQNTLLAFERAIALGVEMVETDVRPARDDTLVLAHDEAIRDGLFGYNAALTAMALGGLFLVLNLPGFIYTVIGVLVTARVWASLGIFLEPSGMPVLTSAFVFVTWLMLLATNGFPALIPVAPADATTPEDNLRRYQKSQKR